MRHIPFFEYDTFEEFNCNRPNGWQLIAVELDDNSQPIKNFKHPLNAVYLLGAEDGGLPKDILNECQSIIQLPGSFCMNVAVAGSIVLFDRMNKKCETK
jgi:tRNA G18 (ribose-2'-O)-methylase SpoU